MRRFIQIRAFLKDRTVQIGRGFENEGIRVTAEPVREDQFIEAAVFKDADTECIEIEVVQREIRETFQMGFGIVRGARQTKSMQLCQRFTDDRQLGISIDNRFFKLSPVSFVLFGDPMLIPSPG